MLAACGGKGTWQHTQEAFTRVPQQTRPACCHLQGDVCKSPPPQNQAGISAGRKPAVSSRISLVAAPPLPCRNLTSLHIQSKHITELPPLPPQLQQLHVGGCSQLRALPALPPTLLQLHCEGCCALEVLPSSLSTTAVSELGCIGCALLESFPQLPPSLVELDASYCRKMQQLPALPAGLKRLVTGDCTALTEVSGSCCWPVLIHSVPYTADCRDLGRRSGALHSKLAGC